MLMIASASGSAFWMIGGQHLGRHIPHRAGHFLADVVRSVVEIALEDEAHSDVGRAAGADVGGQLVDAGDAAERVLHRHHHRGRHLVRRGAGQLQPDVHRGRIGLREEVDAQIPEREDAQHDQRGHQHRCEHRPPHAQF
jgi:hypothetical protein